MTENHPPAPSFAYQLSFLAAHRYLHVPVKNGTSKYTVQLMVDHRAAREFSVELGIGETPDWWAFYDISEFTGKDMLLQIALEEPLSTGAQAWLQKNLHQSDDLPVMADLYQERLRPQFHFTSRRGWNNDPNGLVFYAGEWHMFYQHNPFGVTWGNMHWGHAVSRDLVHWEELPEALYQRSLQDMAFSGGGLVDLANTSGFGEGSPPMVVAFTSTGRGECLAYSNDQGRTLAEWQGNPFLNHLGRDPKIIWFEPAQKWVLMVYEELVPFQEIDESKLGYAFYSSTSLKHWERHSFLPGYFECPEIFELKLDDSPREPRWVIHGCRWQSSPSTAIIGDFDGQEFYESDKNIISHYGPQFYASQVYSNAPDRRVIMVGWLTGAEYPSMPFSQGMTVPLELSLRSTSSGARLCYLPVKELEILRHKTTTIAGQPVGIDQANRVLAAENNELLDIELSVPFTEPFRLDVRGYPVSFDPARREISFAGKTASLPAGEAQLSLRILVDRCLTEVFANHGLAAFAALTIFEDPSRPVLIQEGRRVDRISVHQLSSIWPGSNQ